MGSHLLASTLGDLSPVLFILGGYGFARARWLKRRAATSNQWPTTEGEIVHAHVHRGKAWNDMGHGNGPYATIYSARIGYSYQVGGKRYEGSRVQFGAARRLARRTDAETLVAAYPVGRRLTVHYNALRADDSTLLVEVSPFVERMQRFSVTALALAGCMAIAAGWMS